MSARYEMPNKVAAPDEAQGTNLNHYDPCFP